MRVIITGGTGLIGRPLAASLVSDHHQVIVLSRDPARVRGLPSAVQVVHWDGRSAAGWGQLVEGAGAIVNLAGENIGDERWTAARRQSIRESRTNAGQAVVEAVVAAAEKPGVVIQSSAVGYYGTHGDEKLSEETPAGHDFLAQVAVDWENSTAAVEAAGVRRVLIRTGVVLAREGGAFPRMLLPFRLFAGGPYGNGRQWFPWIHLADEVGAIRFLIENRAAHGPFNLSAPSPLTNRQFATVLGRVLHRPSLLPVPAFVFRLLFGEMATVILDGQRALPSRLLQLGYTFQYPTAAAALRNVLP
jgi:uncharacterized protein (TIGR01777 family)